jgi:hypothetical protein
VDNIAVKLFFQLRSPARDLRRINPERSQALLHATIGSVIRYAYEIDGFKPEPAADFKRTKK